MYQKDCHQCFRSSFGSECSGEWKCPICGNDLTEQKGILASTLDGTTKVLHRENAKMNHVSF